MRNPLQRLVALAPPSSATLVSATLVSALLLAAAPARADVFTLKDGRKVDGQKIRETDTTVFVRTLAGVEKFPVGDIESVEERTSAVETLATLRKAAEKDAKDAGAYWALYEFIAAQNEPALEKEGKKALARVLKLEPDHPGAHKALGEVEFDGKWVSADELERLKAEAATKKTKQRWETKLGVKLEMFETEHALMLDQTGEKDLAGRADEVERAYTHLKEVYGRSPWDGKMVVMTVTEVDDYVRIIGDMAAEWNASKNWVEAVKQPGLGGLWRERPYPLQLRWPQNGDSGMWSAIVHNTAHVTTWKIWGGQPPTWLEEGLGVWVELKVTDDNVATCLGGKSEKQGKTVERKKKKKRKKGDSLQETTNEWKERCQEAVSKGEFPALRKFLRMRQGDYGPAEEGGALGLVTWLLELGDDKLRKLVALMKVHQKDDPPWRETFPDWYHIEDAEKAWFLWVQVDW